MSQIEVEMVSASRWGRGVAICWIVAAVVDLPVVFVEAWMLTIPALAIQLALGVLLFSASGALGKGTRDPRRLVSGFHHFRAFFAIQAILLAPLLAFTILFVLPHAFGW